MTSSRVPATRRPLGEEVTQRPEAAELIGLANVGGVSVYRKRYADFPDPVVDKGRCVLWRRSDIERWAKAERRRPTQ